MAGMSSLLMLIIYKNQRGYIMADQKTRFMDDTMLIQVTNQKAMKLLHELEELQLVKALKENLSPIKTKLSDKYKGVFSKQDAQSFDDHTQTMRDERNNT